MRKLIKSLLILPLVILVLLVVFVITIDPTQLAPIIQNQLAKQGIDARFHGDIGWQFYPNIGLSVQDLELRSLNAAAAEEAALPELARLGSVSFAVELRPLFSRQIRVKGIRVDDAQIRLFVNPEGISNWQGPQTREPDTASAKTQNQNTSLPQLSVQALTIRQLNLEYDDRQSGTRAQIRDFALDTSEVNVEGDFFPVATHFKLQVAQVSEVQIDSTSQVSFTLANSALQVRELTTEVEAGGLDTVTLNGDFAWSPKEQVQEITSRLHIDQLNIEQMLALLPSTDDGSDEVAQAEATPLPLEALRTIQSEFELNVAQLQGFGVLAQDFLLRVDANKGYFDIKKLDSRVFNGQINAGGFFDAREAVANLQLEGSANDIDVGKLLQDFADNKNLAGATDTTFSVSSRGKTVDALVNQLEAEALTQAQSLVLQPLNLEKQYCRLVALLNRESSAKTLLDNTDWKSFTELQPVEVKIHYQNKQIKMQKLHAEVSNLATNASGVFDLESGKFNFPISLSLQSLDAEKLSCLEISKNWLNRSLPLRCKGELGKLGIDTCLPDTDLIKDILKQKVDAEVDAKLAAEKQAIREKSEAEKQRAREKLEEEKREAEEKAKKKLDDKLKNLIDKF